PVPADVAGAVDPAAARQRPCLCPVQRAERLPLGPPPGAGGPQARGPAGRAPGQRSRYRRRRFLLGRFSFGTPDSGHLKLLSGIPNIYCVRECRGPTWSTAAW
ncbi:MAG TPA: hypothetical protein VIV12_14165, partial [Streptosporangiaceae bacterium]